jgi:alkanesulfonate monooxygenase SsuD/methylene tetrahydromethanopterin reductase-like flavin-dependent oxidoreductase (luciferase family)
LLDHNIPAQLKRLLRGHFASTARDMGWDRLRNGDLLAAAEAAGFDAMLTADQSMFYQQNNRLRKLSLVVVDTNHRPTLERNVEPILAALERSSIGSFEVVPVRPERSRWRRG